MTAATAGPAVTVTATGAGVGNGVTPSDSRRGPPVTESVSVTDTLADPIVKGVIAPDDASTVRTAGLSDAHAATAPDGTTAPASPKWPRWSGKSGEE